MSSIIANKTFEFSINIVNLYKTISTNNKEYILSKQLLKSGTSIGANVSEALKAQSRKDFLSKMYIALKETNETEYWIKLLIACSYIEEEFGNDLLCNCNEISKILTSIIKTTKLNI